MDVILYKADDGRVQLEVHLDQETVWLTQDQMADLFGRERSVITKHVRNVFKKGELEEASVRAKFAHTAADGKTYQVQGYNLDVIISVGYRVKSKRGTQFRQWATQVLREHLVRGFTLNEKRLQDQEQKLDDLRRTVGLLEQTLVHQAIGLDEAKGLLQVITDYAYALTTLDRFDHGTLAIEQTTRPAAYKMTYAAAMEIVTTMKSGFGGLFSAWKRTRGLKAPWACVMPIVHKCKCFRNWTGSISISSTSPRSTPKCAAASRPASNGFPNTSARATSIIWPVCPTWCC
jgi:hypothetical protein